MPDVACITLARGAELNTLTLEMVADLDAALKEAKEKSARVVIVTGEGRAFCSGAHIRYFTDPSSELAGKPERIGRVYVKAILDTFAKLREGSFISIAAINGFAFGGGYELALACDFRLMARSARIGLTETRLGAVPGGGGVQLLAKMVGRAKAIEMILLAEPWSAEQALAAGLVTSVHDDNQLADAAVALARRLLVCSPAALAVAKRAIYACETAGEGEADEIAIVAVERAAASADWNEGMAAFREKRTPSFAVPVNASS
ncbi:MAG: enoyl-CoA hydratase/isomerase family protein [Beijerinckiaceae bacterium]|nr:enoyl-CoA hydratase/isomerase family protein [Beijerinckiaceae bacterium]